MFLGCLQFDGEILPNIIENPALGLFPAGFFPAVFSPLGLFHAGFFPTGFFPAGMDLFLFFLF